MDTLLIQHDPEFDMAELEARLYSQIHHSTELWDEPVDQNILKNPFAQRSATQYSVTNISSNTNRYWAAENSSRASASSTKEITSNNENEQNPVEALGNVPNRSMVPTLSDVISICDAENAPVGEAIKTASSNKRAKKSKRKKYKYNKNVAYYDVNGKQLTKKQRQRHRQKMRAADLDPDFGLFATPTRPIKTIAKDKLVSNVNVIKDNILDNGNVVITVSENILDKGNVVVVTDSDSDSDSIIEVPVASPEIYTIPSSDEDELVFVPQLNKDNNDFNLNQQISVERNIDEPEVVEIIEAPVNEEVEIIATLVENTKDKKPVQSTSVIEKERTDLLCTPDSAANDFIEQDVRNMNRIIFFNFNWHGDDLVIPGKEAPKTVTTAADVYETESSCSEAGPRNRPFFNEVDFESPAKEIFCEPNLTKFSNFITPLRSKAKPQISEIITSNFSPISTKASTVRNSVNEDARENVSCSSDEFNSDSTVVQTTKKKSKKKKTQKKKKEDPESDDNQQEGKEKRIRRKSKSDTESKSVGNEKKGKRKSASKSDSESNTEIVKRKKSKWQSETDVIEKLDDQTITEQRPTKEKKSKGDKITEGSDLRINEQRPSKDKKAKKNSESDKTGEGSKQKKCKLQEQSNIIEKIVDIVECAISEKRLRDKKTKKNSESDQIQGTIEKKSKVRDQIIEKLLNNAVEELNNEADETIINEKGSVKDKELDDQTIIEQRITKEKKSKGDKNTEGSDLSNETSENLINELRPTKEKAKKNFEPDITGEGSKQKKSKLQEQSNIIEKIVDKNSEPDKTGEGSKQKKSKSPELLILIGKANKMKKTTVESLEENNTISTVVNKRPVTEINLVEIVRSPKPTLQKEETEIICNAILSSTPTVTQLHDDLKYKKDNSTNNVKIFESPIRKTILPVTKSPGNSSTDDPVSHYYKDTYFADDHLFISEIDKDKEFSFVKSYDKITQEKTKNQLCLPSTSKEPVSSQTPIICCDSSDSDDVAIIENLDSVQENISSDIVLNVKELDPKPIESLVPSVPAFSFVSNFKEIVKKKKTFSDFFTHDMNKFYNEPWEDDLPDVKEMQASMTSDVSKWKVINDDLFPKRRGPMCTKCRERGHIRQYCRKPRGPRKCVLCGKDGHDESRCPDSFCTSCRTQSRFPTTQCNQCQFYMRIRCSTCYFFGHQPKDCPDLWRRYHLTTSDSSQLTVPEMYLKPLANRWCSNCAQRGHLEDQCRRLRMSNYSINPQVVNYVPVYNTPVIPPPPEPNIPKLQDLRVTLSDLRNYKNEVMSNNNQKFISIIRRLLQMCSEGDEYRAERLRYLLRSANNNQFDTRQINELYQIRSKLNKSKRM